MLSTLVTTSTVKLVSMGLEQARVLRNLFELYVHDFSEQVPIALKPNGRFDLPLDERYWSADDHFAYFVYEASELVGFALVRRGSRVTSEPDVMDVAEFFVVRGARRRGVGSAAAHALFESMPMRWEIRIRRTNVAARQFWLSAARDWLGAEPVPSAFEAQGVAWELITLDTAARAPARSSAS
jgi:predicted acetyltransferase